MPEFHNAVVSRTADFSPSSEGGDGRTLEGYAAVFGAPTRISSPFEGTFDETVAPGAFKKTLRENRPPVCQWNHGSDPRVGQVPIAAVQDMREDDHGLYVKARMFPNDVVEPIRQAIEAQAVTGMSFKFKVNRDSWTDARGNDVDPEELDSLLFAGRSADADRLPLQRIIREVRLFEAGPVLNPAYEATSVGVRSMSEVTEADRESILAQYRATMERSGASDGDNDGDDTLEFDHFATDVPVRDDGLPDVPDADYEADGERKAKDPSEPYGADANYADPGYQADKKKRYPCDTKSHVQSALSYIGKASNASKYSAADLAKVKAHIAAAAKKFGIEVSDTSGQDQKKSAEVPGAARVGTPESSTTPTGAARQGTPEPQTPDRKVAPAMTMKTKDEFEARKAEIAARLTEIAEGSASRSLDETEETEWAALTAERSAVEAKIVSIEERAAFLKASVVTEPTRREAGSDRGTPAFHKEVNPYDLDAIRMASNSAEDMNVRLIDNAQRVIERAKFAPKPKGYTGADSADVASGLLETIADDPSALAKRMAVTGDPAYERAFAKFVKNGSDAFCSDEERRALYRAQTLSTNSTGGFAVPFQLDPSIILTNAGVVNPIRQLARQVQITGKQWQGVASAGSTATRGAEAAVVADGSITLSQPVVSTNRVQAFIPFSYELDLSWNSLRAELSMVLLDAKEREEDSFWVGTGTGTGGDGSAPQGVLATGLGTVACVGSLAFSAQDIYNLQAALAPRFDRNASFAGHKGTYNRIRNFDTAGGNALWARIGDGQPDQLMADPAVRVSAMYNGSVNPLVATSKILVYGDFSKYLIVDRIGMNVELIPQVFDATTARPTGQRGLYATWMNNGIRLVDSAFQALTVTA